MNEENQVYFVDSDKLPAAALERKHRLEQDPSFRTNHMEYMEGMQVIQSDIKDKVLQAMEEYDYMMLIPPLTWSGHFLMSPVRSRILRRFYLRQQRRTWSRWQGRQKEITQNHFGNTVYIFTPLYIANYCQNYCIYCGFNCYNNIRRKEADV